MDDDLGERGRQAVFRRIILLEGSIRNGEWKNDDEFMNIADDLLECCNSINECPTQDVSDIMGRELVRMNIIDKNGEISFAGIRKYRFHPGVNDLDMVRYIRKLCRKGTKYENPGNKIKCVDSRFARPY